MDPQTFKRQAYEPMGGFSKQSRMTEGVEQGKESQDKPEQPGRLRLATSKSGLSSQQKRSGNAVEVHLP